ncbi:MAG: N-acetylmuramoyl-L-alanine amidase [Chloroflexia bacterium]|nr:N-acetylmuramoyl-L-alanine amidase [Chloroflexia bacterium]
MIDQTDSPDRERRLGALVFGAATLLAAIIVAIRLLVGGSSEAELGQSVPALPTVVLVTPVAPSPPPATPEPTPQAAATPAPPPVAPSTTVAEAVEGDLVGRVVCLDPGHGGVDQGNLRIVDGEIELEEKEFTLAHTLEIGQRLEARGATVVYTRTTDTEANPDNLDVNGDGVVADEDGPARTTQLDDLQTRVNTCNGAGAELLVSVHYNGAENEFLQGYEVWYSDERPFSDLSASFATTIHEELGLAYETVGYDAFDRGIGTAEFVVVGAERPGELVPSQMPGAVVESLFFTNDEDAAFFQQPKAPAAIIGAYERAIVRYLEETGR